MTDSARKLAEAQRRREYMKQYHEKNKDRERNAARERYRANPQKYRDKQRARYYGVTPEECETLLQAQGHRCAICRADQAQGRGHWHLDHDHNTKKVRGFLCKNCNNGLGFFGDNPERLEQAAAYVRRHKRPVVH